MKIFRFLLALGASITIAHAAPTDVSIGLGQTATPPGSHVTIIGTDGNTYVLPTTAGPLAGLGQLSTTAAVTAHNEITGTDGAMTAGSAAFSSPSSNFTAALIGQSIVVNGAGQGGTDLITTIAAVPSTTALTLASIAKMTVPWWSVGRVYHASHTDTSTSYVIGDLLSVSGGTSVAATTLTVTFSNGSPIISGTNTLVQGERIQFTTTGGLPTNFSTGVTYYVTPTGLSGSQFEVATTPDFGGGVITAGSAGSGTQTANIEVGTGVFKVISLEVATPVVASGGSGGSGACVLIAANSANANQDDGVTRTQWQGNSVTEVTGGGTTGFATISGTISGGAFTLPVVVQPGDYSTAPKAGTVAPATITFTNSSANIAGANSYAAGDTVEFSTTGTLPTNFATGTIYYVKTSGNPFTVAATFGGAAIVAGSAGTGTNTSTSVQVMKIYSGCGSLTAVAMTFVMAPHAMVQTTAGHYTALPTSSCSTFFTCATPWSTTGGTGSGAALEPFGLGTTGNSFAVAGDQNGGYWAYGTDDTTAINAAIATSQAAGGGIVMLPCGRSLMLGDFSVPYTGTTPPVQPPLTLTGCGPVPMFTRGGHYVGGYAAGVVGTIIDNRGTGTNGLHVAKMDTRGNGILQIDSITLSDWGTDNFLFHQTTNTTNVFSAVSYLGNPTCFQQSCLQPMIRLGNIIGTTLFSTTSPVACFNPNSTSFTNLNFSFTGEAFQFGCAANQMTIINPQIDSTSGVWSTGAFHYYGSGIGTGQGAVVTGLVEIWGYPYMVYMDHVNNTNVSHRFTSLTGYDGSGAGGNGMNGVPTLGGFYFDASSIYNTVFSDPEDDIRYNFITQASSPITNQNLSAYPGTPPNFTNGLNVFGVMGIGVNYPSFPLDIGSGTLTQRIRLNGGNTNSADGGGLLIAQAGVTDACFGNVSGCIGGAFNGAAVMNSLAGEIDLDLFNVPYVKFTNGGTPTWYSTTVPMLQGNVKFTTTGCSVSATAGGGSAGTYTSGTTGTCTVVITMNGATGQSAPTGWTCLAIDTTTAADATGQLQTATNATTATIAGTTVSGDVIRFKCDPY